MTMSREEHGRVDAILDCGFGASTSS